MGNRAPVEILAPAGSLEGAKAAVNAGADAIYMGGPLFSARAYAESSGGEDMLLAAIRYAHLRGARVHMTLNTLIREREFGALYDYVKPYAEAGLDCVLVQDLGVLRFLKESYPKLRIHMSTQAAVSSWRAARLFRDNGASRIVLARELSLPEIRRIYEETRMELECFIHGAMCYAASGQCLMSSMLGGRSGNRGRCAGTCRLPYEVLDASLKKVSAPGENYPLSMKDLCTLERLRELWDAGICSFKIEGRMRSPLYTATVAGIYRKYRDEGFEAPKEELSHDLAVLSAVFDRGRSFAYLDGKNGREMLTLTERERRIPDEGLLKEASEKYLKEEVRIPVTAEAVLKAGQKAELTLTAYPGGAGLRSARVKTVRVTAVSAEPLQTASSRPASETEIRDRLSRLGDTPFTLSVLSLRMDGNLFVPVKVLNLLRREAAARLEETLLSDYRSIFGGGADGV